jgi:hypothetical protein
MAVTAYDGPLKSGTQPAGSSTPANVGSVLLSQTTTLAQNSTTAVSSTITLPANSQIVDFVIDNMTAWDSGTTATLSIGTAAAGTQYTGSLNAKTAGRIAATHTAAQSTAMADVTTNVSVVATVTPVGATTVGLTRVTVLYVQN